MAVGQLLTLEDLSRFLKERASVLKQLSFERPLRTIAFYLSNQAKLHFDQSKAPDGTPWLPLKNPSAKRGGPGSKPLRDTDVLMASMSGNAAGHVERVSDTALIWGTNIEYAHFHQWGTKHIPARPFVGLNEKDIDRISKIIMAYAEQELLRASDGQ